MVRRRTSRSIETKEACLVSQGRRPLGDQLGRELEIKRGEWRRQGRRSERPPQQHCPHREAGTDRREEHTMSLLEATGGNGV